MILQTASEELLNVHLGPAAAVADTVNRLAEGQKISVKAFRTESMSDNHYVAQSLTFGDTTVRFRDTALRPVWAGGNIGPWWTTPRQLGPGRGRGRGWGGGGRWSFAPLQGQAASIGKHSGKIAVTVMGPSLDAAVDPQFGRCSYFVLVDTERDTFEALKNTGTPGGNAGAQAAESIAAKGATVLLTGKCGPNASASLAAAGIRVVPGCSGSVRTVVRQFKTGQLQTIERLKSTPNSASDEYSATCRSSS